MATKEDRLKAMEDCGLIAVVRAKSSEQLAEVVDAIKEGGVNIIEITMTTPNALKVIEDTANRYGDEVLTGVGSVLDGETARLAILAGAEYVVGPVLNMGVIEICKRYSKIVIPGAFTPTEIITAWTAGADVVKVFPASVGGPAYFKAILAPLPQVKLSPTDGVDLNTAGDFIKAGACVLGVGSALVEKKALAEGNFDRLTELARKFRETVDAARAEMK